MKLISHWLVCATPLKNAIDRYEKLIEILECSCYFVIVCYMDGIFESLHILWLLDEFRSFVSFRSPSLLFLICWNLLVFFTSVSPLRRKYIVEMKSNRCYIWHLTPFSWCAFDSSVDSSQMKPRNFTNGSWHHTKVLNLTLLTTTITETKTTTTTTTEMMLLLTLQCVKHLPRNDESQFLAQCSEVNVRHV